VLRFEEQRNELDIGFLAGYRVRNTPGRAIQGHQAWRCAFTSCGFNELSHKCQVLSDA
jgi:hypothetical protein